MHYIGADSDNEYYDNDKIVRKPGTSPRFFWNKAIHRTNMVDGTSDPKRRLGDYKNY